MTATVLIVSMVAGAILGFSAHRAGLCTVKAVAEVMTTRRAYVLISFAKSALWVVAIGAVAGAMSSKIGFRHWPASWSTFLGGLLFGVGAGANGGCTFSTLSRLMDGNVGLLVTVVMWPVGMWMASFVWPGLHSAEALRAQAPHFAWWLAVPITLWSIWEMCQIFMRIKRSGSIRDSLLAPAYTLSAGAALIGAANAVLLLVWGPWSFTGTLLCGIGAVAPARCGSSLVIPLSVLASALFGMLVSSAQRGDFRLQRPRLIEALRHAIGGLFMGFGAMLIPGGNDGLILFGMPSFSPHALPAYLGILLGITIVLFSMRVSGRSVPRILCSDDICRTS